MIYWAKMKDRQSYSTIAQALTPVLAVTKGLNPPSLLPKQVGGLSPWCPETVCPPLKPRGSFCKSHF